jgi:hypothetical protein
MINEIHNSSPHMYVDLFLSCLHNFLFSRTDLRASSLAQPFWPTLGLHLQILAVSRSPKSCVSPEVENGDPLQETFKLYRIGPVLGPVVLRSLYVGQGAVMLSHLVIVFGGVRSI